MDKTLTKDARGFVDEVVSYLRTDGSSKSSLPKVEGLMNKVSAQAKKEKVGRVQSSVALTGGEKELLGKLLTKLMGHEVTIESTVNPELLGGFRIQVGDWVMDTSMTSQVEEMAQSLI